MADESPTKPPESLSFDYIKSNFFRVIRADGAWGSLTGTDRINMCLYNERRPIPQQVTHPLLPEGGLGPEVRGKRVSRSSWVREVEVAVDLNYSTAIALHDWLTDRIEEMEALRTKAGLKVRPLKERKPDA